MNKLDWLAVIVSCTLLAINFSYGAVFLICFMLGRVIGEVMFGE